MFQPRKGPNQQLDTIEKNKRFVHYAVKLFPQKSHKNQFLLLKARLKHLTCIVDEKEQCFLLLNTSSQVNYR